MLFQHIIHIEHHEAGMTRPPSVKTSSSDANSEEESAVVWQGDVEADWKRCHAALRGLGTDGRQLELWAHWLASPVLEKGKLSAAEPIAKSALHPSTETVDDLQRGDLGRAINEILTQPEIQHVASVLRNHVSFAPPSHGLPITDIVSRDPKSYNYSYTQPL